MVWSYVLAGFAMLVTGAVLDNIRGPLLPVMGQVLSLSYGQMSQFIFLGNLAAVPMMLFLTWFSHRWSEKKIAVMVSMWMSLAGFAALGINDLATLRIAAVMAGTAVAAMGGITNLLIYRGTDHRRRTRIMAALQTFYSIGALLGPLTCKWLSPPAFAWNAPFRLIGLVSALLGAFILWGVPNGKGQEKETAPPRFRWKWEYLPLLLCFVTYVTGEVLMTMWMPSFMVFAQGATPQTAAAYTSGFFAIMAITRILTIWTANDRNEYLIMVGSLVLSAAAFVFGHLGWAIGLSLAGALGPFFPVFLARISKVHAAAANSLTLFLLFAVHGSLALAHFRLGVIADQIGIANAYWIPPFFLLLSLGLLFVCFRTGSGVHQAALEAGGRDNGGSK